MTMNQNQISQYNLLPSQSDFIFCDDDVTLDVCIYQGGFGSGKTWVGSLLGLLLAEKYPGSLGLVLAKTHRMLEDTTLRTYFEHLDNIGLMLGTHYTFNKMDSKLTFKCFGGSQIIFRHLQDPEVIKSINAAWIECEEVSQFTEGDFMMVLSRVRQSGISRYRVFGHTNPQPTKGWIHKYFVDKNQGKQKIQLDDGREAVIHYRRIVAPTTENVHLSPHYVENMKQQFDEEYFRINVLGQDGDYTAGLVVKGWSFANIQGIPYLKDQRIYLTCDFNVDPMCWALAHRINGEYHFFDEIVLENTNIIQAAGEFAKRYGKHTAGIIITGDASGKSRTDGTPEPNQTRYDVMKQTLSDMGVTNFSIDAPTANPRVETRIEVYNSFVCNHNGERRVKVDPRCKQIINVNENLKYIPGSGQIWQPTPRMIEQDNNAKFLRQDMFDAVSYLINRYDPRIEQRNVVKPRVYSKPFSV